jgi:FkbM family methyltransferase
MNLDRIEFLKLKGFEPNNILDIGCHIGNFANSMKTLFPSSNLFLIDANPYLEKELEKYPFPFKICLLGNENKTSVDFYITKKWNLSSGNSIYKENSEDFSNEYITSIKLDMHKLDDLFPNETFDFVKLDTQGSEVDIINGGINLISKAKYVLIECSIIDYNLGGAKIFDVFNIMNTLKFTMTDVVDLFYKDTQDLAQIDILFKKI